MRVLHVITAGVAPQSAADPLRLTRPEPADSELAFPAAAALIEQTSRLAERKAEHAVVVIGPASQRARAAERGLHVHATIPDRPASARLLARWISASGGFDVAHTWSARSARLASLAIELSERGAPHRPTNPALPGGLDADASRVTLYSLDHPASPAPAARHGAPVRVVRMSEIPAPHHGRAPTNEERLAARARFDIPPRYQIAVLLGDSHRSADVLRFFATLALVNRAGRPVAGIAHERAAQAPRALAMHRRAREDWPLLVADHPVQPMLACADFAIYTGGRDADAEHRHASWGSQSFWVRAARQAGVPVIVPRHPWDAPVPAPGVIHAAAATPPELARVLAKAMTSKGQLATHDTPHADEFARQCLSLWELACAGTRAPSTKPGMESVA